MATSTQNTLKTNLKTQLDDRAGLADVQVTIGWPKSPAKEFMLLGDIRDDGEDTAALGNRRRDERYSLFVIVKVEKETTDQTLVNARAYALAAELEQQLRTDMSVNGAVISALVAGIGLDEFANDRTRMAILTVRVACHARI